MPDGRDDSRNRFEALLIRDEALDEPRVRVGEMLLSSSSFCVDGSDWTAASSLIGSAMIEVIGLIELGEMLDHGR